MDATYGLASRVIGAGPSWFDEFVPTSEEKVFGVRTVRIGAGDLDPGADFLAFGLASTTSTAEPILCRPERVAADPADITVCSQLDVPTNLSLTWHY